MRSARKERAVGHEFAGAEGELTQIRPAKALRCGRIRDVRAQIGGVGGGEWGGVGVGGVGGGMGRTRTESGQQAEEERHERPRAGADVSSDDWHNFAYAYGCEGRGVDGARRMIT